MAEAAGAMAGNLQQAGSAASAGGSSYTQWHGDKQYDKYKLDESGNIVETTAEERKKADECRKSRKS